MGGCRRSVLVNDTFVGPDRVCHLRPSVRGPSEANFPAQIRRDVTPTCEGVLGAPFSHNPSRGDPKPQTHPPPLPCQIPASRVIWFTTTFPPLRGHPRNQ